MIWAYWRDRRSGDGLLSNVPLGAEWYFSGSFPLWEWWAAFRVMTWEASEESKKFILVLNHWDIYIPKWKRYSELDLCSTQHPDSASFLEFCHSVNITKCIYSSTALCCALPLFVYCTAVNFAPLWAQIPMNFHSWHRKDIMHHSPSHTPFAHMHAFALCMKVFAGTTRSCECTSVPLSHPQSYWWQF